MNWKPLIGQRFGFAKPFSFANFLLVLAIFWAAALATRADTIYDDSVNDLGVRFNPGLLEIGDEIVLAGTGRYLTNFSFEYWGTSTAPGAFAGNVQSRVRFYLNDGPQFHGYPTPSTVFYDSGWFGINPTARSTLIFRSPDNFPAGGLFIPSSDITWSAQFRGFGLGDAAGVDLYSPIVVGLGYPDYWQADPAGWTLRTNTAVMNFAAKIQATRGAAPGRPTLEISLSGGKAILSWPTSALGYVLESSSSLDAGASWTAVTSGISVLGSYYVFSKDPSAGALFYRLKQ